ncbi:PQQ-binding-like beta-propeller repeat protein [bacterium]|nr:PQQ-binding-like beta-propeller repeat protein [bacterium]
MKQFGFCLSALLLGGFLNAQDLLKPLVVEGDAVGNVALETLDAERLNELLGYLPGFASVASDSAGYGDVIGMRGSTNTLFFGGAGVAMVVDDVPYGDVFGYSTEFFDLESFTLHRGPQEGLFPCTSYNFPLDARPPDDRLGLMFVRALLFFCLVVPGQAEWPTFRGPTNDGHYPPAADGKIHGFPIEWSEGKNIVWKTPVTGRAWSTPVVMDNEVWVTNATPDGKKMYVVCLDKTTGKKVHDILLFENEAPEPLSNHINGYGSCSPAIDSEHVYIHFGSYGTTALDRKTGKAVWERRDLPCQHFRGPGSSVVLHKNLIILTMDGVDVQYLIALDRKTGKKVWRTERNTDFGDVEADGKIRGGGDFRKAYSTPNFVTLNGVRQLVSPGAKACYSYDADTGKELWKILYKGFSNAAAPVFVGNDMALINTGLGKPHLLGVRLDAKTQGDITKSHIEWDIFKRIPGRCSPVVIGSDAYFTSESGILSVLNSKKGQIEKYIALKTAFSASGVYADKHLYFADEKGKTFVVKPGPELEIVATNQLDDGCMASPALNEKAIYLRTKSHVYRIEKK